MAPAHLRARPDDRHQPLWDDLLLAGRAACRARDRGSDPDVHRARFRTGGSCRPRSLHSRQRALPVLALRGRGLGGRVQRRVRHWQVSGGRPDMTTPISTEPIVDEAPDTIAVPAPTAWPFVLAFGSTLMFAGLVTSVSVSILGVVLAVAGCAGWFMDVFPHEHEELLHIVPDDARVTSDRRVVERVPVATEQVRAWLPIQTYPISAGVKGGVAGSVAMAVMACAYGLVKEGSV